MPQFCIQCSVPYMTECFVLYLSISSFAKENLRNTPFILKVCVCKFVEQDISLHKHFIVFEHRQCPAICSVTGTLIFCSSRGILWSDNNWFHQRLRKRKKKEKVIIRNLIRPFFHFLVKGRVISSVYGI